MKKRKQINIFDANCPLWVSIHANCPSAKYFFHSMYFNKDIKNIIYLLTFD